MPDIGLLASQSGPFGNPVAKSALAGVQTRARTSRMLTPWPKRRPGANGR